MAQAGDLDHPPAVTVVIAFLNEERFLPSALKTVRDQGLTDWELLLVDDGSTDASATQADDAEARDPARVRVLRHPGGANAGLPASRNLALAAARAPYLCFLDADDTWAPDKLDRQLAMMAAQPSVMVCGASWHVDVDGRVPPRLVAVSPLAPRRLRRGRFPRLMVRGAVRTPPPSDVMYDVAALRAVGGVPAGPTMHEDQRTFIAVGLRGPVMVSDVPLTTYTLRSDSVFGSHQADPMRQVRQHQEFEAWVTRYGLRQGWRGGAMVVTLLAHRTRRGLARRARLVRDRLRPRT